MDWALLKATNSFELSQINDGPQLTGTQATLSKGKDTATSSQTLICFQASLILMATSADSKNCRHLLDHSRPITTALGPTPDANNGTIKFDYVVSDGHGLYSKPPTALAKAINDGPQLTGEKPNLIDGYKNGTTPSTKGTKKDFTDTDDDKLTVKNLRTSLGY